MCFGSSPAAPDPVATAQAQNQINAQGLQTGAQLSEINQTSPFGSLTYSNPGALDGSNTANVTLNPQLQALLTGQEGIAQGLTNDATNRLAGIPQDQFTLPDNPNGYNQMLSAGDSTPLQTSFGNGGAIQSQIASAGPIQSGLNYNQNIQGQVNNGDYASQIQQAQNAAYQGQTQYLDPQFARQDQSLESNLAAQGIPVGSEAWTNAMNQQSESKNQAYQGAQNAAVAAGNQEQNTLYGQQLASGQFANQAQNQGFTQALGAGTFGNAAQSQLYGQNANNATFANDAQAQNFAENQAQAAFNNQALGQEFQQGMQIENFNLGANQANQGIYQQNLADQIQGRQENFNELAAFLNGSPVAPTNPTFQNTPTYTGAQASPDAVGLAGTNYNAATQAQSALLSSIFGSLGTLGGAAIKACWVAREVYGTDTNRWMMFRHYLMTKAPAWFRALYIRHGARAAAWLSGHPHLKAIVRRWMDARIAGYADV